MKPVIFRYGLYAGLAILVLTAFHFFIILPKASWETAEFAGYLTMILSMIFVFMGLRYYRDHVKNGYLNFKEGLKLGAMIVLVPAICFALFDILYTEVLNPAWGDEYYGYYVEKIKATTPADKLDEELQKLQKNKELFSNPLIQFTLMAVTVYVIGLIVTIISALTLRRNKPPVTA
jgi:multisubunit Na+/H+ antiporter MnhB subunit